MVNKAYHKLHSADTIRYDEHSRPIGDTKLHKCTISAYLK